MTSLNEIACAGREWHQRELSTDEMCPSATGEARQELPTADVVQFPNRVEALKETCEASGSVRPAVDNPVANYASATLSTDQGVGIARRVNTTRVLGPSAKLQRLEALLRRKDLTTTQKLVGVVAIVLSNDAGVATLTAKDLQDLTSVRDRETVFKATHALHAAGAVTKVSRPGQTGAYDTIPQRVVEEVVEAYREQKSGRVKPVGSNPTDRIEPVGKKPDRFYPTGRIQPDRF